MKSDRDIESWDKRLSDQNRRGWENYLRRRIHLDVARDLELWAIAGEFIYVEDVSSKSVSAAIRLNRTSNDPIDLELATQIKTMFTQVYITHTAQVDEWIDVVWGINFEYFKQHAIQIDQPITIAEPVTVDGMVAVSAVGGTVSVQRTDEGVAQPAFTITNASADTNTVGADQACKSALIRAFTTNTGLVWCNFDAAATDGGCYPLQAGDAISVNLANTNQINVLFKVGGEKVVVIYQN